MKPDPLYVMEKDNSCQIDLANVVQMKEKLAEKGGKPVRRTVLLCQLALVSEKRKYKQ